MNWKVFPSLCFFLIVLTHSSDIWHNFSMMPPKPWLLSVERFLTKKFIFFNWYKDIFKLSTSSWENFSNLYLIKTYPFYLHWISWHEFIHIIPLSFIFDTIYGDFLSLIEILAILCLLFFLICMAKILSIYWSFPRTRPWFHWFFCVCVVFLFSLILSSSFYSFLCLFWVLLALFSFYILR